MSCSYGSPAGSLEPSTVEVRFPPSSLRLGIWAVSDAVAASLLGDSYLLFRKAFGSSGAISDSKIST